MGANLYKMSKCKCFERKIQWNIYLLFAEIMCHLSVCPATLILADKMC